MRTRLKFKRIVFDSARLGPGIIPAGSPLQFFIDPPSPDAESATGEPEKRIASWIFMEQPMARNLILSELALADPCRLKLGVAEPVVQNRNAKPGDVDVLIFQQDQPHKAVALECKRVKVRAGVGAEDRVNKLQDIADGVQQVNALREMGFHRTYFALLIVVDGRHRIKYNTLCRGPSTQTMRQIYDFPLRGDLHPKVGVAFIQIIQPTGKSINEMASIGICVDRNAVPQEQSTDLTRRILCAMPGNQ